MHTRYETTLNEIAELTRNPRIEALAKQLGKELRDEFSRQNANATVAIDNTYVDLADKLQLAIEAIGGVSRNLREHASDQSERHSELVERFKVSEVMLASLQERLNDANKQA